MSEGGSTIGTILEVIEEIRPSTVYTHTIRDVHQDHRNAHSATLVAARGISRIFCYQAPSTTVEFKPTRFVAIDEFLEGKLEVIQAYTSQVKIRDYLDEELLRATARYWSRFSQARYVEPLEVVRDSDASAFASAAQRDASSSPSGCSMPAETPRVLVTGAGGPSGISILRAMEGEPVTMLAGDIDPFAAGLYLVDADAALDPAARRRPALRGRPAGALRARGDRRRRPDRRQRAAAARARPRRVRRGGRDARAGVARRPWPPASTSGRCTSAAATTCAVPATVVADEAFDPADIALPVIVKPRSGSGSRGIRLLERRAELEALERDGTLLVQEHLPGAEYSLDVLARADGHVAARRPARAAEGRLGDRGDGPHAARRRARRASPATSRG